MSMSEKDKIADATQTMLAMTHSIQNRLMQSASNGRMSNGVAQEIKAMARQIAGVADRMETKE
jgi:hypothetical protein